MASHAQKSFSDWMELERQAYLKGVHYIPNAIDEFVFNSNLEQRDIKKAQALASDESLPDLLKIRNLVDSGRLNLAELSCRKKLEDLSIPKVERAEFTFELAIIQFRKGHFQESIDTSIGSLSLGPVPQTKACLYEMLMSAHAHIGNFQLALEYAELADSLLTIFKDIPVNHTFRGSYARVIARTRGVDQARQYLFNYFNKDTFKPNKIDVSFYNAYLQAELDIRRLEKREIFSIAFAMYLFSSLAEDELYRTLDLLNIVYSGNILGLKNFNAELETLLPKYERWMDLKLQISGEVPVKVQVAQEVKEYLKLCQNNVIEQVNYSEANPHRIQFLYIGSIDTLLDFKNDKVYYGACTDQTASIIRVLSEKPLAKGDLFKKVWGLNYIPDLHDSVIRSALHRIRKNYGINIKSSKCLISIPNVWSVL